MIPDDSAVDIPERLIRNLEEVRLRVRGAAERAGRDPASITIVAVTKTVPLGMVKLLPHVGLFDAGENRVHVAETKIPGAPPELRWHFIGHLQRNKVRRTLQSFEIFHSLDTAKLVAHLDRIAGETGQHVKGLLQVNISGEEQKHGLDPGEVRGALEAASSLDNVEVIGLMGMGAFHPDPEETRPMFKALAEIRTDANRSSWYKVPLEDLSMGMTIDYPVAVEEGATMVRIGTAIFEGVPPPAPAGPAPTEGA